MSIIPTSKPANPKVINQLPTAENRGQPAAKATAEPSKPGTTAKTSTTESANKTNVNQGPLPTQGPQTAKVISVDNLNQAQVKQLSKDILRNLPAQAVNNRLVMAQLKVVNTQLQVVTQLPLKAGQQIQVQNQSGGLQLLPQILSQPQQISQQLSLFMPLTQSSKENVQALLNLLKAPLPQPIKEALGKTLDLPDLKHLSQVDTLKQQIQNNGSSVEAKLKSLVTLMQAQTSSLKERPVTGIQNNPTTKAPQQIVASAATSTPGALSKLTQKLTSSTLQQPAMTALRNEVQKLVQGLSKGPGPSSPQAIGQATSQTPTQLSQAATPLLTTNSTNKAQTINSAAAGDKIIGQKSQLLSTLHQTVSHLSERSSDKNIQQTAQLLIKATQLSQPTSDLKVAQPQMLLFNLLQQLKPANPADNDSDKAIKQLIRLLAGSLATINTQQLNSAQLRQHAEPGQSQWQMDLPYIEQQQAGNIQLEIERRQQSENQDKEQQEKQHQWKLTLSFDIEPLGAFYAQIQHDQKTSVQFLCEEQKSLSLMQKELGHLKIRLEELGIEVGTLECKKGRPQNNKLQYSHHLVDVHT